MSGKPRKTGKSKKPMATAGDTLQSLAKGSGKMATIVRGAMGAADGGDPDRPSAVIKTLDQVRSSPVQWLWSQRIALGKVTLLIGNPGSCKSTVTMFLAGCVTTGRLLPGNKHAITGSAIIINADDGAEDTIRPRAEAAGADLTRVAVISAVSDRGKRKLFSLRRHLQALDDAIGGQPNCKLVILDPVSAFLESVDAHRNNEVYDALTPFADLAQRREVAVVFVHHLNKGVGASALNRSSGSEPASLLWTPRTA